MPVLRTTQAVAVAATLWLMVALPLHASDELAHAKDLYRAAAYEDALAVLNGLTGSAAADAVDVNQYRVLCLVALDRRDEAKQAIAALVAASPSFQMSDQDASPRVRAMFAEVRRSLLPGIVQRAYADAKAAFDRKDPEAAARFDHVLVLLKDPDVARDPAMADLATVATGFRDLSQAAVHAPAAGATPDSSNARPTSTLTRRAPSVVPPVTLTQEFPPLQIREAREWDGEVEVVIDERGKVVSARMTKPVHPLYDPQLLRAAKNWTYKPALRDGVPARMIKLVAIHLDSRPECSIRVRTACRPASR